MTPFIVSNFVSVSVIHVELAFLQRLESPVVATGASFVCFVRLDFLQILLINVCNITVCRCLVCTFRVLYHLFELIWRHSQFALHDSPFDTFSARRGRQGAIVHPKACFCIKFFDEQRHVNFSLISVFISYLTISKAF